MKLTLLMIFTIISSGKQGSAEFYRVDEAIMVKFVNQKNMPASSNLCLDKSIVNNSYPIEMALYKDGQFYYDLPNRSAGKGNWKNLYPSSGQLLNPFKA